MRHYIIGRLARVIRITQIHRVLVWIYDRVRFFLIDWFKRPSIEFEGERKLPNVAIFAIFQPSGLSEFVRREIEFVRSMGYDIVLSVPHGLSKQDQTFVHDHCRLHVKRPNLGRDFGSYRDGILQLGFEKIAEYDRVLLVNDSIFFPLGPTDRFVSEFQEASSKYDLVGLTENGESIRHIASFFIGGSSSLFCSTPVQEYWKKYRLYNSRFHAIRAGECGLSKVLYKCAKSIGIIYSKERIIADLYEGFDRSLRLENFVRSLPDGFFSHLKEKHLPVIFTKTPSGKLTPMAKTIIIDSLRHVLEASSVPHSFGLSLMAMYGFPLLKRDVYYHDIVDLAQVYLALQNLVDEETLNKVIYSLRKKGASRSESAWGELMVRIGMR
jgi:hypothetical protein